MNTMEDVAVLQGASKTHRNIEYWQAKHHSDKVQTLGGRYNRTGVQNVPIATID